MKSTKATGYLVRERVLVDLRTQMEPFLRFQKQQILKVIFEKHPLKLMCFFRGNGKTTVYTDTESVYLLVEIGTI